LKIKFKIVIVILFTILTNFGQTGSAIQDATTAIHTAFYLYYGEGGVGSNMEVPLPTIRIKDGFLTYTFEDNIPSLFKEKYIDTVCIIPVRQSSIDSILYLIQDIKDTTINKSNFCIMSGSIHFMTITNGHDSTKFSLMNTFDYTALKIANILNTYIPVDKKLHVNEKMIKDAEACWTRKLKRWKEKDKKKNLKKSTVL